MHLVFYRVSFWGEVNLELNQRISKLVSEREDDFRNFINSRIAKPLRAKILAEEILSETVRYALEHPALVKDRSDEKLFFFLLWKAKLLVCDRVRNIKAASNLEQTVSLKVAEKTKDDFQSPTMRLHREDKRVALENYIALLPNRDQRTVLQLMRVDNFNLDQVSETMGRSPEAVKKLVRRAMENLISAARRAGSDKFLTTGETK